MYFFQINDYFINIRNILLEIKIVHIKNSNISKKKLKYFILEYLIN